MDSVSFSTQNIYTLLTPLALFFIAIEVGLCIYYKKNYITFSEAVANFGTALGNQTVNVLVAAGVYTVYGYLWEHFRLIDDIPMNVPNFLILLLGIDFIFYWVHRWGHEINIMWAAHSPHHSAQEMNFFVALRASVTQRLFSFFFFWPLTIIGFRPFDIYMMTGIHLFISFLHHTELIPKLWRWIEFVFTTPSHHRVHHGVNFKYLDKNYGEFLIIWDRLFGSFEEETDKVIYGMYGQAQTWNPISINFHYYRILWKDAKAATNWWDKIRIWFMPLGWRPANLPAKPPLEEITLQNQQRISLTPFAKSKVYLSLSAVFGIILMLLIISPNSPWTTLEKIMGSVLLWHLIINWSGILEAKDWLFISEITRIGLTVPLIFVFSDLIDKPVWLGICLVYHTFCLIWTMMFFRK
ncbi:sterol desaturase family protein [Runella sp. MFBS21]|uniref:sterol desaturase family protein n=1 Tax=Runella sp. MFBS21 TaxID=3034018 RepID=UPI0023FA1C85|nr:sterol desaturase family protein [Runella sp. MFBS21]MDF7819416.1 sterol desaturase family protein [Runella sp. MFBS21]